ncbi:MAG: DUF3089 domain-containing protein [Halioglobus sp.]|nr:DUF3089 domain-containing protein [Halioglobus sp.]
MKWIKRGFIAIAALLLLGVAVIFATGNGPMVKIVWDVTTGAPDQPFDPAAQPAPPPDYALESSWAALPTREDLADLVPAGVTNRYAQGAAPVDVFFVHPTGFLKGTSWTFSMDADTSSEENTKWMMANQASPYNGCCNVYAPRYRQASIFAYMTGEELTRDTILGFAYKDVERAFDHYLQTYNNGRPFVLASHSQGTHHGLGLLLNRIDGTELAERMVAAFLIGGYVSRTEFSGLKDIPFCDAPDQLGCVIHWDTYSIETREDHEPNDVVCVNPLSWRLDGPLAGRELHRGAVPVSGEYHLEFAGSDAARGVQFDALKNPLPNYVEARCEGGRLYVTDQSGTQFSNFGGMGDSYHGLDYPLFYMDIRDNAILRANTWLERSNGAGQ